MEEVECGGEPDMTARAGFGPVWTRGRALGRRCVERHRTRGDGL